MNSKERVKEALLFNQPDKVPVDFWADKIVIEKLIKFLKLENYEQLLKYLGVDLRYIDGAIYTGPPLETFQDNSIVDIWGVRRKTIFVDSNDPGKGSYTHVVKHPLAFAENVNDLDNYNKWPSADYYNYSETENMADRNSCFSVVCGGDRLNRTAQLKPMMYMRGVEQTFLDLTLNPDIVEAIIDRLVNYYLDYNRRIFEAANGKIDIFFMGDDFGTQNGLFMGIDMWQKFFKSGFKKFIELAHSFDIKVMHHSCGAIEKLIPEFIDCGLDILQSLQPAAAGMDLKKIKQEYGRDICFQGSIDIQNTMPNGTTSDVVKEVRDRIDILASGGGYILSTAHNIQADTPLENILALYDEAGKYGIY